MTVIEDIHEEEWHIERIAELKDEEDQLLDESIDLQNFTEMKLDATETRIEELGMEQEQYTNDIYHPLREHNLDFCVNEMVLFEIYELLRNERTKAYHRDDYPQYVILDYVMAHILVSSPQFRELESLMWFMAAGNPGGE